MDHSQAVEQMAAERYLLDELTPEVRDAFEEHVFDCPECAMDLRAAAAFVDEAKAQLPALTASLPPSPASSPARPSARARLKRDYWLSWLRPAFAVPAFATMLLTLSYQNLVTFPALRAQADQPRVLPWVPLYGATRGGAGATITADRRHGIALPIDLSPRPGASAYADYSFDLLDPQGKLVWTGAIAAPPASQSGSQRVLLAIPGPKLNTGSYTVAVSGVGSHGDRTLIERYVFNLSVAD